MHPFIHYKHKPEVFACFKLFRPLAEKHISATIIASATIASAIIGSRNVQECHDYDSIDADELEVKVLPPNNGDEYNISVMISNGI